MEALIFHIKLFGFHMASCSIKSQEETFTNYLGHINQGKQKLPDKSKSHSKSFKNS